MALQFKENDTFYAGITFLDEVSSSEDVDDDDDDDDTMREHTKYKIRLGMDETPKTHELKPK